ncbi:mannitol-1-phosphate 5-dehydrogenase [Bacillus sp. H-16]|uniref:mannitol-1-phosphate 5-dehydrogenase n=1 Tax=Alteribacter salitolerans TaxID=2912333 RepID=UPI00196499A9|nr:mannitol-1-phosphate 5-dehydrogenase [Alteribacter salitolerans]MBM7097001.1 mannitol-1-phosphate 5-dehydrogenase [Alteribacter salitolerans]
MKAVHFGAGNIGRGFIGQLLYDAGAAITFVDVNDEVINAMNSERHYDIVYAQEEELRYSVHGVKGLNSRTETDKVVSEIAEADIVTTAVGPNVLKFLAPVIKEGLVKRSGKAVDVIACENMVGGSEQLKQYVLDQADDEERRIVEESAGFPNAAVDRIVPEQVVGNGLDVTVEPFYEWIVETEGMKNPDVRIPGILYVEALSPYIERKLFTVNTGHAAAAYLGSLEGYKTIAEAMADEGVFTSVRGALEETGKLLTAKYDSFSKDEQKAYIEKVLARFVNPKLVDDVKRVGRTPLRKLGRKERLISPAEQLMKRNGQPAFLVDVIVAALSFRNEDDPEAVKLAEEIQEKGVGYVLRHYSQLEENSPLYESILEKYNDTEK